MITVEPQGITIQNVGDPDRSISAADISRCEILVSKRYRNRRLGEYLKELDLTEGRSTGIPTIQNVLENNGSPRATIVTDEDRTFFRIMIPSRLLMWFWRFTMLVKKPKNILTFT